MQLILDVAVRSLMQVWITFRNAWPYLLFSAVMAAALRIYLNPERIAGFLSRHQKMGVVGATAAAVATPFCSCGTMAVTLGMIANFVPLAPIVSFLASSPLTSPEELIYSAGLFGWRFAWTFWASSIFVGLAAGTVAGVLQWRGALSGQIRLAPAPVAAAIDPCACSCKESKPPRVRLLVKEALVTGQQLLLMFLCFAFIGYFLNGLIPSAWIKAIFGGGRAYSVLIAATLGFPVYVNTEASLPMIRALIDSGMSQGAALAFLITGAGTSVGAIIGLLTVARWRVIAIVVGTLWGSAVLFGMAYNFLF